MIKRQNHILITDVDIPSNKDSQSSDRTSSVKNPTTPPSSHSDYSESTFGSSDEAYSPVPKRKQKFFIFLF